MSTPTLLLVDGDPNGLRVMEVSLRREGFQVVAVTSAQRALEWLPPTGPACAIISSQLPDTNGLDLLKRLDGREGWDHVPILLLTPERDKETIRRALDLGVEDFLTRPVFVRELLARIRMILDRQARTGAGALGGAPLEGAVEGLALVDVLTLMEGHQATGVVYLNDDDRRGRIYVRSGSAIDAKVGHLDGEEALFRLLRWSGGNYTLDLREVHHKVRIDRPTRDVLAEAVEKVDAWETLRGELPEDDPVLEVDFDRLAGRLGDLPDEVNYVLRLFDGVRTVSRVVDDSPFDDLEALQAVVRLQQDGLLRVTEAPTEAEDRTRSGELEPWLRTKSTPPSPRYLEPSAPLTGPRPSRPTVGDLSFDRDWRGDEALRDRLTEERARLDEERRQLEAERRQVREESDRRRFRDEMRTELERERSLLREEWRKLREPTPAPAPAAPLGPTAEDEAVVAAREASRRAEEDAKARASAILREAEATKQAAEEARREAEAAKRQALEEVHLQRIELEAKERAAGILREAEAAKVEAERALDDAERERSAAQAEARRVSAEAEAQAARTVAAAADEEDRIPTASSAPLGGRALEAAAPPELPPEELVEAPIEEEAAAELDAAAERVDFEGVVAGGAAAAPQEAEAEADEVDDDLDVDLDEGWETDEADEEKPRTSTFVDEWAAWDGEGKEPAEPITDGDIESVDEVEEGDEEEEAGAAAGHEPRVAHGLEMAELALPGSESAEAEEEPEVDAADADEIPAELDDEFFATPLPALGHSQDALHYLEPDPKSSGSRIVLVLVLVGLGAGAFGYKYLEAKRAPQPIILSQHVEPVPPTLAVTESALAAPAEPADAGDKAPAEAGGADFAGAVAAAIDAVEATPPPAKVKPKGAGSGGKKPAAAAPAPAADDTSYEELMLPPAPNARKYRKHFQAAERHRRRGKYKNALKAYARALSSKPRDPASLVGMGNTYYELDRISDAARTMQQAIRVAPKNPDAYLNLGMVLQAQRRNDEAKRAYGRFLELSPKHEHASEVRGVMDRLK